VADLSIGPFVAATVNSCHFCKSIIIECLERGNVSIADQRLQYITLNLKAAGFTTFEVNLLTIPAYVIFIINLLVLTWLSEKLNERFLLASISQIWVLPLLIALETLPATRSHWVTWILSILLFAQPYAHAIIVAITSRNAGTVRTRTVASALYNMSVQTSSIIGSNV